MLSKTELQALQSLLLKISDHRPALIEKVLGTSDQPLSALVLTLVTEQLPDDQRSLMKQNPVLTGEDQITMVEQIERKRVQPVADPMRRTILDCLKSVDVSSRSSVAAKDRMVKAFRSMAKYLNGTEREQFLAVAVDEIAHHGMDFSLSQKPLRQRMDDVRSVFGSPPSPGITPASEKSQARQWRNVGVKPVGLEALQRLDRMVDALVLPYHEFRQILLDPTPARQTEGLEKLEAFLDTARQQFGSTMDRRFCDWMGYIGVMSLGKTDRWDRSPPLNPVMVGQLLGRVFRRVDPSVSSQSLIGTAQRFEQFLQDLEDNPGSSLHDRFLPPRNAAGRAADIKGKILEGLGKTSVDQDWLHTVTEGFLRQASERLPGRSPSMSQMLTNLDERNATEGASPSTVKRPGPRTT